MTICLVLQISGSGSVFGFKHGPNWKVFIYFLFILKYEPYHCIRGKTQREMSDVFVFLFVCICLCEFTLFYFPKYNQISSLI